MELKTALNKSITAYMVANQLGSIYKSGKSWYDEKHTFRVTIQSNNPVYDEAQRWIRRSTDVTAHHSIVAKAVGSSTVPADRYSSGSPNVTVLEPQIDERSTSEFMFKGHKIAVALYKPDKPDTNSGYLQMSPDSLIFSTRSPAGQQVILEQLQHLLREQQRAAKSNYLWTVSSYGEWNKRKITVPRPIESVILADGQRERICNDLEKFIESEDQYNRRALPWHRGYLFYGPPGTGKTSLANALSNHFGLDLWYLSLADLGKDATFQSLVREINTGGILLLEDIDVFGTVKDRDAEKNEVSLSGLLNALDGLMTPHGLITVMTTNNRDVIDKAILRPGRIDMDEYVGYACSSQIARAFEYFYSEPLDEVIDVSELTLATVMEIFKKNSENPEASRKELVGLTYL